MSDILTVAKAIEALGGTGELAAALGVVPSAVRNWRRLNAIPKGQYYDISAIAEERGVALDRALFRELTAAERL